MDESRTTLQGQADPEAGSSGRRNSRLGAVGGISLVLLGLLGGAWLAWGYLLSEPAVEISRPEIHEAGVADRSEATERPLEPLVWPSDQPLTGQPAKELLLRFVQAAVSKLESVPAYTASLIRQERIDGKLGPEQKIQLKVRHQPFAVYMRFVEPDAGKEAIFAEGSHDDHVVAHGGGLTRLLVPHLKVPPRSRLALNGNRHPITEAGLLNLARKLVRFRELDMEDDDAETVLDRVVDSAGRQWLRSIHTNTIQTDDRPFAYVEILYDPATSLPSRIHSYEWPGKAGDSDRPLAERYEYQDLNLDAELSEQDFDYRNPNYNYKRF